jgi:hypothetical protein
MKYAAAGLSTKNRLFAVVLIFVLLFVACAPSVLALTDEQKAIYQKQIYFFDVSESQACTKSDGSTFKASGSTDIKKVEKDIFQFFLNEGLKPFQAAGIMGNMKAESGLNPRALQPAPATADAPIEGRGFGLIQWTFSDRQAPLVKRAKIAGVKASDLTLQLNYVMFELEGRWKPTYEKLKKTQNSNEATEVIELEYESHAGGLQPLRKQNAKDFLVEYGSLAPEGGSNDASDSACEPSGNGESGPVNVQDGYAFPIAIQKKSDYETFGALSQVPCKNLSSGCHHNEDGPRAGFAFDLGVKGYGPDRSQNAPVYAITDGVLKSVRHARNGAFCNSFQLVSKDGYWYWYGHLAGDNSIKEGMKVSVGDRIGKVGQTACADHTAPHLHIDRGYPKGSPGGGASRDKGMINIINDLFAGLPG